MCTELVIGLIGLAVVMGAFFVFALLRWPGAWDEATANGTNPSVYGERVHYSAIIRQPYNTWSNLFAVALGLIVLGWLCGAKPGPKPANPMLSATLYSALYAYALMFLGPGSMFFHASMKKWGGVIDNVSMNLYISFILLYDLARMTKMAPGIVLVLYLVLNVLLALLVWRFDCGKAVFGGLIGLTLLFEGLILFGHVGGLHRQGLLLLLGLIVFLLGFIIWNLAQEKVSLPLVGDLGRGPLYMPDSWFQGHAVWHILSAAAAFIFFLYFRSEG
jgi:hypothetical protein